jgi:D-alanyl-D-alanine carboxypeptidase
MEDIPITQKMPLTPEEKRFPVSALHIGAFLGSLLLLAGVFLLNVSDAGTPHVASAGATDPFADVTLTAKSAIVVDLTANVVLYEKSADTQLPLASLTKIALALAVSEVLPRDVRITIPTDAAPDVALRLGIGKEWRVGEILDFTLVTSSNGGAELLARVANDELHRRYSASPTDGATVWRMNDLARELGLEHTFFLNPSGLDESTTQSGAYGSARDMARLFAHALRNTRALFEGTARNGVLLTSENGARASAENTNAAQGALSGLIMGKTGFTDLAGGNLGVVFDVGIGHPVVAIVLGSTYDGRFENIRLLAERARMAIAGRE